jgi:exosortase
LSWIGLVAIAGGLGFFVLSAHAGAVFVQRVSLLIVLTGLVAWVFGRQCLRILGVPLGLLLFAIPPPLIVFNAIAFPLQGVAARMAERILGGLGIPVLREGVLGLVGHVRGICA